MSFFQRAAFTQRFASLLFRASGWSCNDVASEIIKTIQEQFPEAEDGDLRQKVADNLRICFLREEPGNTWEDGMTMGFHSKVGEKRRAVMVVPNAVATRPFI